MPETPPPVSPAVARPCRSLAQAQEEALQRLAKAEAQRGAAEAEVLAAWRACINLGCAEALRRQPDFGTLALPGTTTPEDAHRQARAFFEAERDRARRRRGE